jgi:hypothetical protein
MHDVVLYFNHNMPHIMNVGKMANSILQLPFNTHWIVFFFNFKKKKGKKKIKSFEEMKEENEDIEIESRAEQLAAVH